ncbi:MAG: 4-amino-4-deoxychorismate lyase [Saprospiraceae bacterium]|nr:4-amino-4-deoxychorismate lyase [Saprospiraceae bacterium]
MNIKWHNQRCHHSRTQLFNTSDFLNLRHHIDPPRDGLLKCRIIYDNSIRNVEYELYSIKPIKTLKAIHCDLDYSFKYADRESIRDLYDHRGECDDILMIKDGLLTDTSYGNIALLRNQKWYTPETPILEGTRRASLLHNRRILSKPIYLKEILQYSHLSIFNAMIPFGEIIIPVKSISVD